MCYGIIAFLLLIYKQRIHERGKAGHRCPQKKVDKGVSFLLGFIPYWGRTNKAACEGKRF